MFRHILGFTLAISLIFPPWYQTTAETVLFNSPLPVLQLVQSNGSGVILDLFSQDYRQVAAAMAPGIDRLISWTGLNFTRVVGKPQVPVVSTLIGVPADASLELHILADDAQPLLGIFEVPPAPSPTHIQDPVQDGAQDEPQVGGWDYKADPDVYSIDASYPSSPVMLASDAWVRDQRIVRVDFYPFQYNPARGSLTWHSRLRAEVVFIRGKLPVKSFAPETTTSSQPDPFAEVFKSTLINYDTARLWRGEVPVAHNDQATRDIPKTTATRYKINIDHDGLYQLSFDDLLAAGVDLTTVNPQNFRLSSQGQPVAISLAGAGDGHFNPGDTLTFYGQRFYGDRMAARYASESANWITYTQQLTNGQWTNWHPTIQPSTMEKYTDNNVYWLDVDGVSGPGISTINGNPDGSPAPNQAYFNQTIHAESSNVFWPYSFTGQDIFYWDRIQNTLTHTYTTTLTALSSMPYSATIKADIVARTNSDTGTPDHHLQFFINNRSSPVEDVTWDGVSRYHLNVKVPQSALIDGVNTLKVKPIAAVSPPDYCFDWFEITYARQYQASNNSLTFTGDISGTWKYQVSGFASPVISLFDITQPLTPTQIISTSVAGSSPPYTLTFVTSHPAGEKFIAADSTGFQTPRSIQAYQDHLALQTQGADYVMITAPELITATQALADYRQIHGLHTMVVNVNDIYNEFNDGIYHPFAIKQFLKFAYTTWQIKPVYVVLVGDGNWNFKGYAPANFGSNPIYMPPNMAWVDPWQGEADSANLLANIVGDDPLPDLFISRMPVGNQADLYAILNKISKYENTPIQNWQRNMLFVADNYDSAGDFSASSDILIQDYVPAGFTSSRIYLDNYFDSGQCLNGSPCPPATRDITQTLSITGSLFLTYSGHGAIWRWATEKLLGYSSINQVVTVNDIATMNNGTMLPVVVSLDCLDGYWFHPTSHPSLAELFLTTPNRGAVSTFSPTGLGLVFGHDALASGFFTSIFTNGNWELGPASLSAKLALFATGNNYDLLETYTIFGDPALKILSPYQPGLTPSSAAWLSPAGKDVSYQLSIQNQGSITDTYKLTGSGNTWVSDLPASLGPISPGGMESVKVTVHIPLNAALGTKDTLHVSLASNGDTGKVVTTTLNTTAGIGLYLPVISK